MRGNNSIGGSTGTTSAYKTTIVQTQSKPSKTSVNPVRHLVTSMLQKLGIKKEPIKPEDMPPKTRGSQIDTGNLFKDLDDLIVDLGGDPNETPHIENVPRKLVSEEHSLEESTLTEITEDEELSEIVEVDGPVLPKIDSVNLKTSHGHKLEELEESDDLHELLESEDHFGTDTSGKQEIEFDSHGLVEIPKMESPKETFNKEVNAQTSNEIIKIEIKETKLPSDLKVATKTVDKDVASQDTNAKELTKEIDKSKGFFSGFQSTLKSFGQKIKDFFFNNKASDLVFANVTFKPIEVQISPTETKKLTALEVMKGVRTGKRQDAGTYGGSAVMQIASGQLSNKDRKYKSDKFLVTEGSEFRVQSLAIGKFLNYTFDAMKKGQNPNHTMDTFMKQLNQDVRNLNSDAELQSFFQKIDVALKDTRFDPDVLTYKNDFANKIDDLKKKFGSVDIILSNSLSVFKSELPKEIQKPSTFFRGASEAPTFLQAGFKLDSPKYLETVLSSFTSILNRINDEKDTPRSNDLQMFHSKIAELKKTAPKGKTEEETKQLGIEHEQNKEKIKRDIQILENKICVSILPEFVHGIFGENAVQQRELANKLLGPTTQHVLRSMNDAIMQSDANGEQKDIASNMWNSNNFVLRSLSVLTTGIKLVPEGKKPGTIDLAMKLAKMVTQATNDIENPNNDDAGDYCNTPEYNNIRLSMPGILRNVIDGCQLKPQSN